MRRALHLIQREWKLDHETAHVRYHLRRSTSVQQYCDRGHPALLEYFADTTINYTPSMVEFTDNDRDFFIRTDASDHGGGVVHSGIAGSSCVASVGDLNATAT